MRRASIAAAAVVGAGTLATIVASCTIFDGLSAAPDGGSVADSGAPPVDAGEGGATGQPGYLSLADGVSFCSNVFACPLLSTTVELSIDVPVDVLNFTSCVDWVSGPLPTNRVGHDDTAQYLRCAAGAKSCTAAASCFWDEQIDSTDPRCKSLDAGSGACAEDGGAIYYCGSGGTIYHCSNSYFPSGFSCMRASDSSLYCAGATCSGDQCTGGYLEYCGSGTNTFLFGNDCNAGGFTCGFDAKEGFHDCLTNGVASRCAGLSVACDDGGVALCDSSYLSRFDCNLAGGTCDPSGFPRCTRPAEACTPRSSDVNTCSGTNISLCLGGAHTTFDCATVGKTCLPASSNQSAHCG